MTIDLNRVNPPSERVIGAAIKVHRALGLGLLESVYQACLVHELQRSGLPFAQNVPLPVEYDGVLIRLGFRLDVVVDNCLVLEIKSVRKLSEIHDAQLLTYLKLSGFPVGLLVNFNATLMKKGMKRLINPDPSERFVRAYENRR